MLIFNFFGISVELLRSYLNFVEYLIHPISISDSIREDDQSMKTVLIYTNSCNCF